MAGITRVREGEDTEAAEDRDSVWTRGDYTAWENFLLEKLPWRKLSAGFSLKQDILGIKILMTHQQKSPKI